MNGKFKALTLAIVAMFCLTAVICVIDDKDSSAADSVEHYAYFEIVSEDGLVTSSDWVKFTSTNDAADFVEKANTAFAYYGYDVKFTYTTYITVDYEGYNACYVGSEDGKSWVEVTETQKQYPAAKYLAFSLANGYISEATYANVADKTVWKSTGWGDPYAYIKAPAAKTTDADTHTFPEEYTSHIFVEVIGADGKDTTTKWVEFTTLKTKQSFIANANTAFANNDLSKLTFSSSGWVSYDGSSKNATYYAKDKEWAEVNDSSEYYKNDTVALAVSNGYITKDVYNALSDSDKKTWKDTTWGDPYAYMKIVDESTTGYEPSKSNNNTALIIGIVVVVAVLAVGIFFFTKKK